MPDTVIATNSFYRSFSSIPANSGRREPRPQTHSSRQRVERPHPIRERRLDELRERVVASLASLGYPSLIAVDCQASSDRIVLSGTLPSYHLKQMAQVAALRVAGPGRVDNRVVVTPQ
jgi:hypothetical protein